MGGNVSTHVAEFQAVAQADKEADIVNFVMPIFYTKAAITPEEYNAASNCWKMILNNKSQYFFQLKEQEKLQYTTVMEYFYEHFYTRLFDVHPSCRGLFQRSINKQGSFFLRMISLLIGELDDKEKFQKSLVHLAELHNKIGVKAVEYGISGEVLMYTIKKCVGPQVFDQTALNGWCKIYSRMLDVIIPVVVHFELTNKEAAEKIYDKRMSTEPPSTTTAVFSKTTHTIASEEQSRNPITTKTV